MSSNQFSSSQGHHSQTGMSSGSAHPHAAADPFAAHVAAIQRMHALTATDGLNGSGSGSAIAAAPPLLTIKEDGTLPTAEEIQQQHAAFHERVRAEMHAAHERMVSDANAMAMGIMHPSSQMNTMLIGAGAPSVASASSEARNPMRSPSMDGGHHRHIANTSHGSATISAADPASGADAHFFSSESRMVTDGEGNAVRHTIINNDGDVEERTEAVNNGQRYLE